MEFFAAPADLRAWLLLVEADHPIRYAHAGAFSYPDTPVYDTIADVRNLDRIVTWFFLLPPEAVPIRRQPKLARGGPWYYVDGYSEENHKRPWFRPGTVEDGVLQRGSVTFSDERTEDANLKPVFTRHGRQTLYRLRDVWLGPEALTWLVSGTVRFEEEHDGEQRKTPRRFHPCKLGKSLFEADKVAPGWRTPDVMRLAQSVRDGDPAALPILGDALEDAGCTDADFLGHCRWSGKHHAGCWIVPLLLAEPGFSESPR